MIPAGVYGHVRRNVHRQMHRHVYRHACRYAYLHAYAMCTGVCIDCVQARVRHGPNMRIDMCADMVKDMCADKCTNMCTNTCADRPVRPPVLEASLFRWTCVRTCPARPPGYDISACGVRSPIMPGTIVPLHYKDSRRRARASLACERSRCAVPAQTDSVLKNERALGFASLAWAE